MANSLMIVDDSATIEKNHNADGADVRSGVR